MFPDAAEPQHVVTLRWLLATVLSIASASTASSPASAALGGPATNVMGENCTPYNTYNVGFAIAGGGQIKDQRVLLSNGWDVFGWVLLTAKDRTKAEHWWFVPYAPYFTGTAMSSGTPPAVRGVGAIGPAGLEPVYRAFVESAGSRVRRNEAFPKRYLIAPCFSKPWPGPYELTLAEPLK